MSFQGDVRGIGLAELLQGLSRGRKEGVLALTGDNDLFSVIGIRDGKTHLLATQKESPDSWRERVRDAWAHDPEGQAEPQRQSDVAHAERLESVYKLLDGGGVHFRFDPGELKNLAQDGDESLLGPGVPVEFLLLEYARISDELEGIPELARMPRNTILRVMDPSMAPDLSPAFVQHMDGNSTIQEIADRMQLPIRAARLAVAGPLQRGALRYSTPFELLNLAVHELRQKNFSRAASRLVAWCTHGEAGPMAPEFAEALSSEWVAGRLPQALVPMTARHVRVLLRRMDHTLGNPSTSVIHWSEAARLHPDDRIIRIHRMLAEFREDERADRPSLRDIFDICREFRDESKPLRTGPLLVIAAHKHPEGVSAQLELGLGLVEAGRAEDGTEWVLAAARDMIGRGQSDRAITPLRQLITAVPRSREARALLTRARRSSTSAKQLRKTMMIGSAGLLAIAGLAFVQVSRGARRDELFREVERQLADPAVALSTLDRNFPGERSGRVKGLRRELEDIMRVEEQSVKSRWLDEYHAAQKLCVSGDPLEAILAVRAIDSPPRLTLVKPDWPEVASLYATIGKAMEERVRALPVPRALDDAQKAEENTLETQARTLRNSLVENERKLPQAKEMVALLTKVEGLITERREDRHAKLKEQQKKESIDKLAQLLNQAEDAVRQNDYERALRFYDQILESDIEGSVRTILEPKVRVVRSKQDAIERAHALAYDGKHTDAIALLAEKFDDPSRYMLPWNVESIPSGAMVKTSDGNTHRTPFERWSTPGESIQLRLELEGYETRVLSFDQPAHRTIQLSRRASITWSRKARVDAIPVPVGPDRLLLDRSGHIARVDPNGQVLWEKEIQTISGVARAPVFLPELAGRLLMVTEDGSAWILDAASGSLDGPVELGSPPQIGPVPDGRRVKVSLADGSLALWKDSIKPVIEPASNLGPLAGVDSTYRFGAESGMQVVRRRNGQLDVFSSRFGPWDVTFEGDALLVSARDEGPGGFSVLRRGQWEFLAFEPKSDSAPGGRLWLSDSGGLRAFDLTRR